MELGKPLYKSEYIKMGSENKVSRQSVLWGSQNIVLSGKTIVMNDCIIRGDLTNVKSWTSLWCEKSECPKATIQEIQQRLHFFLYILGTTSLLRKIVWSTQLILALVFTLARIVWLGAGVSWKAVEKFLTTQYYPQKLWSPIHRLLRLPRTFLRGASRMYSGADDWHHQERLPTVFPLNTGLMSLPCVLNLLELWDELGDKVSQTASTKSSCVFDTSHPLYFLFWFHCLEFLSPPRL